MSCAIADNQKDFVIAVIAPVKITGHNFFWSEQNKIIGQDFSYFFRLWQHRGLDFLGIQDTFGNIVTFFFNNFSGLLDFLILFLQGLIHST